MKLTYIGHACFVIENAAGGKLAIDPYKPGSVPGLSAPDIEADEVICSHGHADHSDFDAVRTPAEPWNGKFEIRTFKTFHDDKMGILRGRNNINMINIDGLKIVHMGDIGCRLQNTQIDELRECDVLMIPVGGFFTINARQAFEMLIDVDPRAVIPMHYRGVNFGYNEIAGREEFVEYVTNRGIRQIVTAGSEIESIPDGRSLILMEPLRKM